MSTPLVSLLDMLEVYANAYVELGKLLREVQANTAVGKDDQKVNSHNHNVVVTYLAKARTACRKLDMLVCDGLASEMLGRYKTDEAAMTYGEIRTDFGLLESAVRIEIKGRWLLAVLPDRVGYYRHGPSPFGEQVAKTFPDDATSYNIREACKCWALERHTACVFHSMIVVQKGLEWLAGQLHVPNVADQWGPIIERCEEKVKDLGKTLPPGQAKSERLQLYGELLADTRHFKEAWRNYVAHGRESYEAEAASKVLDHVESFMRRIAPAVLAGPI
jgi:hypothetical protein